MACMGRHIYQSWGELGPISLRNWIANYNSGMNWLKEALYVIWCCVNRLGDSGVNILADTSHFVNPAGQLLLTRRGKTRTDGVGIVF